MRVLALALSLIFVCLNSTIAQTPLPVITHSFTLPRPFTLSAAEIDALTLMYCNALGEYFCKSVYLVGQSQVSSQASVKAAIRAVIADKSTSRTHDPHTGLELEDILSRDIGTYASFRTPLVDAVDPTSFFSSFFVKLTPEEARAHPRPDLLSSFLSESMSTLGDGDTSHPSIPVPISALLTETQANRILAISGLNVTVHAGIFKADGISVWQLATYIGRVKEQLISNIQSLLTATDVYDFSEANIAQYPAHCRNGIQDENETGVDCGGDNVCVRCGKGQGCQNAADCLSLVCTGEVCEAPRQLRQQMWDD